MCHTPPLGAGRGRRGARDFQVLGLRLHQKLREVAGRRDQGGFHGTRVLQEVSAQILPESRTKEFSLCYIPLACIMLAVKVEEQQIHMAREKIVQSYQANKSIFTSAPFVPLFSLSFPFLLHTRLLGEGAVTHSFSFLSLVLFYSLYLDVAISISACARPEPSHCCLLLSPVLSIALRHSHACTHTHYEDVNVFFRKLQQRPCGRRRSVADE